MITKPADKLLMRLVLTLLATAALILGASTPLFAQDANTVDFVEIDGVVDPVSERFLVRQISNAERRGSAAVILRLDTPGGLDVSMRKISSLILNAKVPVVVWVAPAGARAGSAGVFIAYSAHISAMARGTNIGAAHPVNLTGGEPDDVSTEKAANDAAAFLKSIALKRGRNVEFAEAAVLRSESIDAERAVEIKAVDFLADNTAAVIDGIQGRTVEIGSRSHTIPDVQFDLRFHKMNLLERLLHSTINPEVAYFLLLIGFYALIFELYNPGIGLAGLLGGVSLIFSFYALSILPASWAAVALIALAVAFFLVDLHTAGLGVFTAGGTVALIAGSLLLFSGASAPFRLSWWAVGGAVAATAVFFILIMTAAIKARIAKPLTGSEGMVGTTGTARTDIAPEGQVMAKGTLWRARTAGAAIPEGSPVTILGSSGLVLMVEPAKEPAEVETT